MNNSGILLINKPIGLSTFDLIRLFKRANPDFKGKIGHAGTLDVFASGLAILLVNTTKHFELFQTLPKTYQAGVRLNYLSDTLDVEGILTPSPSDFQPSRDALLSLLEEFTGTYDQTVPLYSATKQDGQTLYSLARAGKEIKAKSKPVTIHTLSLLAYKHPLLNLEVSCSSGTYIRQLTFDILKKLDVDSFLFSLTRTQIGEYHLQDAIPLSQLSHYSNHLLPLPVV